MTNSRPRKRVNCPSPRLYSLGVHPGTHYSQPLTPGRQELVTRERSSIQGEQAEEERRETASEAKEPNLGYPRRRNWPSPLPARIQPQKTDPLGSPHAPQLHSTDLAPRHHEDVSEGPGKRTIQSRRRGGEPRDLTSGTAVRVRRRTRLLNLAGFPGRGGGTVARRGRPEAVGEVGGGLPRCAVFFTSVLSLARQREQRRRQCGAAEQGWWWVGW